MSTKLDEEFKLFLRWRGFNIDSGLFTLEFNAPQNFAAYRQSELDTSRVNTFASMEAFPYISKRFALERFLGLSEEEITKNEKMWREENNKDTDTESTGSDLRNIGVSAGDLDSDLETADQLENPPPEEGENMEVNGPVVDGQAGGMPGGTPAPAGNAM
jgi:hypothetical protein